MNLQNLYDKYKKKLTESQRFQVDVALLTGVTPSFVAAYFDDFRERTIQFKPKIVESQPKEGQSGIVIKWHEETKALLKERSFIHSQLRHYTTNEERKDACFTILELTTKIEETFNKIDVFEKKGIIEDATEADLEKKIVKKVVNSFNRERSLRAYISELEKKLKNKPNDENLLNRLSEHQKELQQIRQYLHGN